MMEKGIKGMFKELKNSLNHMSNEDASKMLVRIGELADSAKKSGQEQMLKTLKLQYDWSVKEITDIVPAGYDTFLNIEDINEAVSALNSSNVRHLLFTDVRNYTHTIPEDSADKINHAKEIFDKVYILHTDFSGKDRKETDEVRKEKDPIAFGTLISEVAGRKVQNPHYYYITDWEDEYCDLTLAKLVDEYNATTNKVLPVKDALKELAAKFEEVKE